MEACASGLADPAVVPPAVPPSVPPAAEALERCVFEPPVLNGLATYESAIRSRAYSWTRAEALKQGCTPEEAKDKGRLAYKADPKLQIAYDNAKIAALERGDPPAEANRLGRIAYEGCDID